MLIQTYLLSGQLWTKELGIPSEKRYIVKSKYLFYEYRNVNFYGGGKTPATGGT